MLKWAFIFFTVAIVAGLFGFTGIASGAATVDKWLFFPAIAVPILVLLIGVLAGETIFSPVRY